MREENKMEDNDKLFEQEFKLPFYSYVFAILIGIWITPFVVTFFLVSYFVKIIAKGIYKLKNSIF
jgi:uncharacterized membrane protein (DUF106 family)